MTDVGSTAGNIEGALHLPGYLGRKRKVKKAYDPSEARDEHGRWSDGDWPSEDDGTAKAGDEILVYRLGSQEGGLAGRNAGNLNGVANHLVQIDDFERPAFNTGTGSTITAYRVKLGKDPGDYQAVIGGGQSSYGNKKVDANALGRTIYRNGDYLRTAYSFPKSGEGFTSEKLASVPLASVKEQLKSMGYSSADDAGGINTAKAISAAFANRVKKAAPRTLYVNRPVLNAQQIIDWAKANGFSQTVTPDDMHVTVAFSRTPVDWSGLVAADNHITIRSGDRALALFGSERDCAVLRFESKKLAARWQELCAAGASWDWPDYHPHLTLSYSADQFDPSALAPYDGPIVLGPEVFAEVKENWKDSVVEKGSPDQPRDSHGRWTSGDTSAQFVDHVNKHIAGTSGLSVKASKWKSLNPGSRDKIMTVTVHHQSGGFAQALLYSEGPGKGIHYTQHDVSLPVSERGNGTGGKMVGALATGFKKLGLSKVPIHVNTNPEFWQHMDAKYHVYDIQKMGKAFNEDTDMDLVEVERVQKAGARHSKKDRDMIQTLHDHAVSLGADCGMAKYAVDGNVRIAKVDESLGLVMGWAVICKINGEPYYDLNIDKASDGTLKRVPEHIPEAAMMKAAANFMQTARPGNEMHSGPDTGTHVFAFPLTSDVAKAFGIETPITGLMIAYKPTPEIFAKFLDGTYTGFSVEGSRIKVQEHD